MASDIPSQISFEEMLSHTFPGFFSAITLFMLMAIFSPIDITSWAIKDLSSLGLFIGFILLGGTILGIIIDDIHHSIVEDGIFENIVGLRKIKAVLDAISPGSSELKLGHQYFFQKIGEKQDPTKIFEFIIKSIYRYSEFYANTFISLVPFSLVAPFYLSKVLQIQWSYSILFGLIVLFIACFCLNGSYVAFREYQKAKLSVICGYLGYERYIELKILKYLFTWGVDEEKKDDFTEYLKCKFDLSPEKNEVWGFDLNNLKNNYCEVISKKQESKNENQKQKKYLFSWDDVADTKKAPGNEKYKLIYYLKDKFGLDWLDIVYVIIRKIDNNTIKVKGPFVWPPFPQNYILIRLNDTRLNDTTANLTISTDKRTDEFIAKKENGKLNIYQKDKKDGKIELELKLPDKKVNDKIVNDKIVNVTISECYRDKLYVLKGNNKQEIYGEIKCKRYFNCNIDCNKSIIVEARIFDISGAQIEENGIQIFFKTTAGRIDPISDGKTENGVARARLIFDKCDKCETIIVTATSKGFPPSKSPAPSNYCIYPPLPSNIVVQVNSPPPSKSPSTSNGCVPGVTWVEVRKGE